MRNLMEVKGREVGGELKLKNKIKSRKWER